MLKLNLTFPPWSPKYSLSFFLLHVIMMILKKLDVAYAKKNMLSLSHTFNP